MDQKNGKQFDLPIPPKIDELRSDVVCKKCSKNPKTIYQCGRCKCVYYCSLVCQKVDWKDHQKECSKLREKRLERVDLLVSHYARVNVQKRFTVTTNKDTKIQDIVVGLGRHLKLEHKPWLEIRINPKCLKKKYKRVAGEFCNTVEFSQKKLWELDILDMFETIPNFEIIDDSYHDVSKYSKFQNETFQEKEKEMVDRIKNLKRTLESNEGKYNVSIVEKEEFCVKKMREKNYEISKLETEVVELKEKVESLLTLNRKLLLSKSQLENQLLLIKCEKEKKKKIYENPDYGRNQNFNFEEEKKMTDSEKKELYHKTLVKMKEDEDSVISSIKLKYECVQCCKDEMNKVYHKSMTEIRKVQRELKKEQEEYLSKSKSHLNQLDMLKELMGL